MGRNIIDCQLSLSAVGDINVRKVTTSGFNVLTMNNSRYKDIKEMFSESSHLLIVAPQPTQLETPPLKDSVTQ